MSNEIEINEELVEEIAVRIATKLGLDTGRRYWEEINLDEIISLAITLVGKAHADGFPLPGERKQRWGIGTIKVLYAQNGSHDLTNYELIALRREEEK